MEKEKNNGKGKREMEKKCGFPTIDGVCYDVNIRVFQIISAQTGRWSDPKTSERTAQLLTLDSHSRGRRM